MINDYYFVTQEGKQSEWDVYDIRLNPESVVYQGHFPEVPVSPGVCNIQMIRECASRFCGRKLRMTEVCSCRLKVLVSPLTHSHLQVYTRLADDVLYGEIRDSETVCMELKAKVGYE